MDEKWVLLYQRKYDDSVHYSNLLFSSEQEAYSFAKTIQHLVRCIAVTHQEFLEWRDFQYQALESELGYWRSRQPRPVQRNITEVIPIPEDELPQEQGYVQNVQAIVDEREKIPEARFRNFSSYKPAFVRPEFGQLRKKENVQ